MYISPYSKSPSTKLETTKNQKTLSKHSSPLGIGKPDQVTMIKEKVSSSSSSTNSGKTKMRKGLWSPEEDEKLMNYMLSNGQGCWSDIARNAGLMRCGKSCRLRWINYLRPDLKRGAFSNHEEEIIIQLHSILGNRWSQIAARLPGRTDNEIKNFWNSTIKKRLKNNNNFSTSTSISPNCSDSAELMMKLSGNVMGSSLSSGAIFMQEYDVVCLDSSSSSTNYSMHAHNMPPLSTHFTPNLFDVNGIVDSSNPVFGFHACMQQEQEVAAGAVKMMGFGGYEEEAIVGLENDLSVPGMLGDYGVGEYGLWKKYRGGVVNNSLFLNNNGEELVGVGNHWQEENLKMGELEWESLLANISSLPYIDFQVE